MRNKDNIKWKEMEIHAPDEFRLITSLQYGIAKWGNNFIWDLGFIDVNNLIFKLVIKLHTYGRYTKDKSYEHIKSTFEDGLTQHRKALDNVEVGSEYLAPTRSQIALSKKYNLESKNKIFDFIKKFFENPWQL